MPASHDWAGAGRSGGGGGGGGSSSAEYWKLAVLGVALLLCLASYFTGTEHHNPLNINVPLGINLRLPCKPAIEAEAECRKGHQQEQQQQRVGGQEKAGGGDGGFFAMVREAGAMAEERAKAADPSATGSPCATERARADDCKAAAQTAREKIQLRCNAHMADAWSCEHADTPGEAKKEGRCAGELERVAACARSIHESSMRRYIHGGAS